MSSLIWVHTVCHRGFLNILADEKSRRFFYCGWRIKGYSGKSHPFLDYITRECDLMRRDDLSNCCNVKCPHDATRPHAKNTATNPAPSLHKIKTVVCRRVSAAGRFGRGSFRMDHFSLSCFGLILV